MSGSKRELKAYIKDTTRLQKDLFTLSETSIKVKEFPKHEEDESNESTSDSIFATLDQNFKSVLPFVEETIEKWNSRTQMIKNINSSSHQMSKSKAANKTILEQVYSLMNEPANRARLIDKAR